MQTLSMVNAPIHRGVDVRGILLVALGLSILVWMIPGASMVLIPITPYVTFVHEGWHAFAAIATGGHVSAVHIFGIRGGGITQIAGGATLLIASAGYVGSALTGTLYLALLPRPHMLRMAIIGQYLWLVVVVLLWDHDLNALGYLVFFGGALYALAAWLPERWFAIVMGFLALQLALAVLGDLQTLLFLSATSRQHSDAVVAAQVTHLPGILWAVLWTCMSGLALLWSFQLLLTYPGQHRPRIASRYS